MALAIWAITKATFAALSERDIHFDLWGHTGDKWRCDVGSYVYLVTGGAGRMDVRDHHLETEIVARTGEAV